MVAAKYPLRVCWGEPVMLGVSVEQSGKIGLIAGRMMKQLAEAEKKKKAVVKKYKAEADDVEF